MSGSIIQRSRDLHLGFDLLRLGPALLLICSLVGHTALVLVHLASSSSPSSSSASLSSHHHHRPHSTNLFAFYIVDCWAGHILKHKKIKADIWKEGIFLTTMTTMMDKVMTKQSRVKLDLGWRWWRRQQWWQWQNRKGQCVDFGLVSHLHIIADRVVLCFALGLVFRLALVLVPGPSIYKKLILSEIPKHHQHKVGNPLPLPQMTYFNLLLLKTNLHPLTIKRIILGTDLISHFSSWTVLHSVSYWGEHTWQGRSPSGLISIVWWLFLFYGDNVHLLVDRFVFGLAFFFVLCLALLVKLGPTLLFIPAIN